MPTFYLYGEKGDRNARPHKEGANAFGLFPVLLFGPGLDHGQVTRFKPVSQVKAVDLVGVADAVCLELSGIDPVAQCVAVDVNQLGCFNHAEISRTGAEDFNCVHTGQYPASASDSLVWLAFFLGNYPTTHVWRFRL
jgi:hypothetical protein